MTNKMKDKKTYYNLRYDDKQLDIIINALKITDNYYNDYVYDVYDNFTELSEIIEELEKLK